MVIDAENTKLEDKEKYKKKYEKYKSKYDLKCKEVETLKNYKEADELRKKNKED